MDIGASGVDEYSKENHNAQVRNNNMLAPQQHQQQQPQQHQPSILLQDTEPWRGSSGFGLANILNRSLTSNSSSGSSSGASGAPLPKFSLPSLHAFGKPLLSAKPEIPAQHSMLKPQSLNQRSPQAALKLESVRENPPRSLSIHTSDPSATERKPAAPASAPASPLSSKDTTPRKQNNNNSNNGNARRIAPAPADDEDGEQDDDLSGSIRGGRWTADEHERFLAGFRIHGHKWKRVQQVVRTRSVTQVRTHAQKYLLKVAKLKAEKKQGKAIDVSALNDRYLSGRGADSSSDNEQGGNTAPSSPDNGANKRYYDDGFAGDTTTNERSPKSTPPPQRKKMRHQLHHNQPEHQRVDVLDQEYIAAAATTLCFLMSQKIDTLFDSRNDMDKDLEPYDCYSDQQSVAAAQLVSSATAGGGDDKSRKRAYMHFLTESPVQYPADGTHFSYDENDQRTETPSYAIEGKKLYS